MHYSELPEGNLFCPLPWIGATILPHGRFASCCLQDNDLPLSDLSHNTIDEIRRNEYWTSLRRDLINGVQHGSCRRCWKLENRGLKSARHGRIKEFSYYMDDMRNLDINPDGSLDEFAPIRLWDVRETNLCNMKCVMCHPALSSLWNEEAIKHKTIVPPVQNTETLTAVIDVSDISKENILDTILSNINHIESIYFAGGEPLISTMHWSILDALVENKRFDVRLLYNTNLLKMSWRGRDVIDYWKQFNTVYASVSIDCIGTRAEYVRYGTVWETIDANVSRLVSELPGSTALSITTSLLTIGGLGETLRWAASKGIAKDRVLCNNIVYEPTWANIKLLPGDLKQSIWHDLKHELSLHSDENAYSAIEKELFDELDREQLDFYRGEFKRHIGILDAIRGNSLVEACPELAEFYTGI